MPPSSQLQPALSPSAAIKTIHLKPWYASQAITDAIKLSSSDDTHIQPKICKGKWMASMVEDKNLIEISDSDDGIICHARHQAAN